jgi:hypothetical protein
MEKNSVNACSPNDFKNPADKSAIQKKVLPSRPSGSNCSIMLETPRHPAPHKCYDVLAKHWKIQDTTDSNRVVHSIT